MKACIHRDSKEIGGTCIEIESQGQRIILDIGCPLDCTIHEATIPEISGIKNHDKSLLGIIVSHPHLDHYGLLNAVKQNIPVLIGDGARKIINAANFFFPTHNPKINNYLSLNDRKSIALGPFIITPYLVDHSENKIPLKHCHTSGHAPIFDLQRFSNAIKADRLVPIHSFEPNLYHEYFENVERIRTQYPEP